jgi:hypothetical protein
MLCLKLHMDFHFQLLQKKKFNFFETWMECYKYSNIQCTTIKPHHNPPFKENMTILQIQFCSLFVCLWCKSCECFLKLTHIYSMFKACGVPNVKHCFKWNIYISISLKNLSNVSIIRRLHWINNFPHYGEN